MHPVVQKNGLVIFLNRLPANTPLYGIPQALIIRLLDYFTLPAWSAPVRPVRVIIQTAILKTIRRINLFLRLDNIELLPFDKYYPT